MSLPIETFALIDSTNAEAVRQLADGRAPGFALRADAQSGGRGRRGRDWVSPSGNLYTSIVLDLGKMPAGDLALICSLAVAEAAVAHAPDANIALKWPNDVLLDGGKLAGLLLERHGDAASPVIIGIGVNIASKPDDTPYPAACLDDAGGAVGPHDLLEAILAELDALIAAHRMRGMSAIRERWITKAKGVGEEITVRLLDGEKHGVFEGLAEDGRLQLGLPDGSVELISAGDVFFAPSAGKG